MASLGAWPMSCSASELSPDLALQALGMSRHRHVAPACRPCWGCCPWSSQTCRARGRRSKGGEPWWVAHPKVAWLWHWQA